MKKMIKLSLVAAVAVAGLTTTSSAANLEDAIKGTQVTGYVRYRLNNDLEAKTDMNEDTKAVVKFTSPVNDMVTANVKVVSEANTVDAETKADTGVTEGNFVIKAGGATVIAGLQTSQSPFLANNGDTRSHGVTALVPVGPVTIAAAHYMTTVGGGLAKPAMTNDINALGVLGKFGSIGVNAWTAQVQDGADLENAGANAATLNTLNTAFVDASAISLQVTAAAGPVDVEAMMTQISNGTGATATDTGVTKLVVSGKAGAINYMAGYAMSAEDGGMVSLDQDSDNISDFGLDNLNMAGTTDATAMAASVKYTMSNGVCAMAAIMTGSDDMTSGTATDFNEMDLKVGYKMSKNFKASIIKASGTDGSDADFDYTQIEVKYTF